MEGGSSLPTGFACLCRPSVNFSILVCALCKQKTSASEKKDSDVAMTASSFFGDPLSLRQGKTYNKNVNDCCRGSQI